MLEEWIEEEIVEELGSSTDFVNAPVEPDRYVMVKTEDVPCPDPCDACLHRCQRTTHDLHVSHECGVCALERERLVAKATSRNATKQAIRNDVKSRKPESFHYLVDKTICLFKDFTAGEFNNYDDRPTEERTEESPRSFVCQPRQEG